MFKGKKTYVVAILWGAATIASTLGFIDPGQVAGIQAVLAPLGLAALRHGVNK